MRPAWELKIVRKMKIIKSGRGGRAASLVQGPAPGMHSGKYKISSQKIVEVDKKDNNNILKNPQNMNNTTNKFVLTL
jgi:hypothetical protein